MEREQAREILKKIHSYFPNFNREKDREIDKNWLDILEEGDYEKTRDRLNVYIRENVWPPAPAHILVVNKKPRRVDEFDAEAAREAVEAEKKDPEMMERRRAVLEKFEAMVSRLEGDKHE